MPFLYETSPVPAPLTPSASRHSMGMKFWKGKDGKKGKSAHEASIGRSNSQRLKDLLSSSRDSNTISNMNAPARRPGTYIHIRSKIIPAYAKTDPTENIPTVDNPFPARPSGSEAPPTYTAPTVSVAPGTDDPYAFLAEFDTIFLIDDSGSMSGAKWRETADALKAITPICTKQDKDGIDIYFLNTPDSPTYQYITSERKVQQIFDKVRPGGGTPTGQRLNAILKPYLRKLEARGAGRIEGSEKPLNIIVITDGEAHDDPETVIFQAAKKLDKLDAPGWQVGIQFFQVGNDPEATKALNDLDDGLVELGCERDIVDTVPWRGTDSGIVGLNAEGILKVVLVSVCHSSYLLKTCH